MTVDSQSWVTIKSKDVVKEVMIVNKEPTVNSKIKTTRMKNNVKTYVTIPL